MTQKESSNEAGQLTQGKTSPGYPYPPEELWRRLVEVIKTHPDELTYRKFGQIFGLEFDEDKMRWYGDRASGKYFLLTKESIRNTEAFPFHQISLSQGDPDPAVAVRVRRMSFGFEPFDDKYSMGALLKSSKIFCIKPKFPDIETLGYHYDEIASTMPPLIDSNGNRRYTPYTEKIFHSDPNVKRSSSGAVYLQVLPNGCLVGVSYINYPKF